MNKAPFVTPGSRQISAGTINRLVKTQRTADNLSGAGRASVKRVHGVAVITVREPPVPVEPFQPSVHNAVTRVVRVAAGICYAYGEAFSVDEVDVTLDTDARRVWVQFPITPGSTSDATVEFGSEADLAAVDRNLWGFRVLAHISLGDDDEIVSLARRWFGGDVYFDD